MILPAILVFSVIGLVMMKDTILNKFGFTAAIDADGLAGAKSGAAVSDPSQCDGFLKDKIFFDSSGNNQFIIKQNTNIIDNNHIIFERRVYNPGQSDNGDVDMIFSDLTRRDQTTCTFNAHPSTKWEYQVDENPIIIKYEGKTAKENVARSDKRPGQSGDKCGCQFLIYKGFDSSDGEGIIIPMQRTPKPTMCAMMVRNVGQF